MTAKLFKTEEMFLNISGIASCWPTCKLLVGIDLVAVLVRKALGHSD